MGTSAAQRVSPLTGLHVCPSDEGVPAEDSPGRDPAWNPWLYCRGDLLKQRLADVVAQLRRFERTAPRYRRKRDRRPADDARFLATIDALVAHASYEYLRGAGAVRYSRDNNILRRSSRYVSQLYSKQLPKVIDMLSAPEMDFLSVTASAAPTAFSTGRQPTFKAAPRLISRLAGVTLDDIARHPGEELVLLKGDRDGHTGTANLIEYDDTDITEGYRREVRELNEFLAAADVQYVGEAELVDDRDRFLKRRFTRGTWGTGGRLWGGFWQNLKKADRLTNVLIDSEPVVSVDFSSMALSLAYTLIANQPVPPGDLYAITFTNTSGQPVAFSRDVVKKIAAAALNGAKDWPSDLRQHRSGLPWSRVGATLKATHAPIAAVFESDVGQQLAFVESEILTEALLSLKRQGVVALPVHDCVVVAESEAEAAVLAMLDAFMFHTRHVGRVSLERSSDTGYLLIN